MPGQELDPTIQRELRERLARLDARERSVLAVLSSSGPAPRDTAVGDVVAEIRRKLEVASTLAAVAVHRRADGSG
ncbi:hypothetical protein [Nocardioides sp. URHA0020]|uniref:hypothetical protein n=1 Tax=Nocardioides sp. URHA0020 TaxID=1380392 RepID=UPI0004917EFF|nr:hypothetical protein [Nocardioides sp. URHA0020]